VCRGRLIDDDWSRSHPRVDYRTTRIRRWACPPS